MHRGLIHFGGGMAVAATLMSGVQAESSSPSSPADHALGATQVAPQSEGSKDQGVKIKGVSKIKGVRVV